MGFSLSAATAMMCVCILIMFEIFSSTIIPDINEIQDSLNDSQERLKNKFLTDVQISGIVDTANPWWNITFNYRKPLTVNSSMVADNLINFPVLVDIVDENLKDNVLQSNGNDIAFMDSTNTVQLNHQIELFDENTGHLVAWVNVSSISSSTNTLFYMYYGNATCPNQQNVLETWDSDFVMVNHMNETSGPLLDSTVNNNDGTCFNGVNQSATGVMDGGYWFDGFNDYITVSSSDSLNVTEMLTVEGWVKDPPIKKVRDKKNIVEIIDKRDERRSIIPERSFTVKRRISGDGEVVFAALFSPGIILEDMIVDKDSVFQGMFSAESPRSRAEEDIENYRVLLPPKLLDLPSIGYTKSFEVHGTVTVTMEFSTTQMIDRNPGGRISYLVFSEDSMDFEATTHWSNMFSWKAWDPFSPIFDFVNKLIGGEQKKPLVLSDELDTALSEGESVRVMVSLDDESSFNDQSDFLRDAGFEIRASIDAQKVVAGFMDKDVFDQIKTNPKIKDISVDEPYDILLEESLPLIRFNKTIDEFNVTGEGVTICLLDTGVDSSLVPYSYGYDFVNDDADPFDDNGHGTQVASVIYHMAPAAELIVAKVLDSEGFGYASDVLAGLQYCIDQNPDIISFSIGSTVGCPGFCDTDLVTSVCNEAVSQGIFVVAAAGNDGSTNLVSPACGSSVFSVGASDERDRIADFSNVNPTLDMLAPGVDITTNAGTMSGTSVSVPHVTAAAALIMQNEMFSPELLKYRLRSTGAPIMYTYNDSLTINIARLDLYNAMTNKKTVEPFDYSWWWQCDSFPGSSTYTTLGTATYYFNSYDSGGEEWAYNPAYMVNGGDAFSSTDRDGEVQLCLNNTYTSGGVGTISKVELRARTYYIDDGPTFVDLRPVFGGSLDGNNHPITCPLDIPEWSSWMDITSDTNAPSSWTWSDVANLDCDVIANLSGRTTVYCSFIEIKVTYSPSYTYYFTGYEDTPDQWDTNPNYMVDGNESTYTSTTNSRTHDLSSNSYSGGGPGCVEKVELRAKTYYTGTAGSVDLRPVFGGTNDGDNHSVNTPKGTAAWSNWFDITDDTNAPSSWAWSDVTALDCDVDSEHMDGTVFCSKVEIRVTFCAEVVTNESTAVEEIIATLNGYLKNSIGSTTCGFWYDTVSGGTSNNISVGIVTEGNTFNTNLLFISPGQLYFFKAWANDSGSFNDSANEKTFLTKPWYPADFSAATVNSTAINLSWTKGGGANYTRIQRKTKGYPTNISDGTNVYNGTGTSFLDTGLGEKGTYYYRAWSYTTWTYNPTLHQWSDGNGSANNKTNNIPIISNEGPSNESTGINPTPQMNITVNDADGDSMTIRWYSNSSGSWQQFGINSSVGNGTYHQVNSIFSDGDTTFWWYVTVGDIYHTNASDMFHFTTSSGPPVVLTNGSTGAEETNATLWGYLSSDGGE